MEKKSLFEIVVICVLHMCDLRNNCAELANIVKGMTNSLLPIIDEVKWC